MKKEIEQLLVTAYQEKHESEGIAPAPRAYDRSIDPTYILETVKRV